MAAVSTRKQACLFCRIRKLKCVSSQKTLPNGQKDPCGNCMIYKCHCESYTGVNDKSLIRSLSDEDYNTLVIEREKMLQMTVDAEMEQQQQQQPPFKKKKKSLAKAFIPISQDTPGTDSPSDFNTGTNNSHKSLGLLLNDPSSANSKPSAVNSEIPSPISRTNRNTKKISKFLLPTDIKNSEYTSKLESLNLLKKKLKELEPILLASLDDSAKPSISFLKSQVELKTKELAALKKELLSKDDHNNWNIEEFKKITSKAKYCKTNSMETSIPVDKFDIVKNNKISHKPKKRKLNATNTTNNNNEEDEEETSNSEPVVKSLENELLCYCGHNVLNLNWLLSFNLNAFTGEVVSTPQLSFWNDNQTTKQEAVLHYLPTFFGEYNTDAHVTKPGLELVFQEILKLNPNYETIPEREIKETLFLVLKFVQYYLSCSNIAVDIFSEPFEFYANNLIPELRDIQKTTDKLLFLYSRLPKSLIDETLKQYPKFTDIHNNCSKYVTEPAYAATFFQYVMLLSKTHQLTFKNGIISLLVFTEQDEEADGDESDECKFTKNLEFFEEEDILLIFAIHFAEKARYSSAESLDYLESLLLRFEQGFTFQCKAVTHEGLTAMIKSAGELGLHKFEYYLEVDEAMAEKQRKLFWKCIYWDVRIQIEYGMAPLFSLSTITCLLPKAFLDLGVMTVEDLKWFLLNEGYKCIFNIDIEVQFEILNIGFAVIVSDFMQEVLFHRKYIGISSLLKSKKTENILLIKLLDDLEYYNRFGTIFKLLIDNIYRKLLNMEMSRNLDEEGSRLTYLKYLINASIFRSFMMISSISIIKRLQTSASDPKVIDRSEKLIEVFSELVMTNELNTLNIVLIAEKTVFLLRSFDAICKCLANITAMASYLKKPISSEIFINIVRLHKIQRMTHRKIISKAVYFNKETIHRIPSFINLFCHRLRLAARIIAQLFMSQRSLDKDKLKDFFKLQLSEFISDSKELTEELSYIFDAKLMENNHFANLQYSMNKKRYDTILKRYTNMGNDLNKVASSKNLNSLTTSTDTPVSKPLNKDSTLPPGSINEFLKVYNSDFNNAEKDNSNTNKSNNNSIIPPNVLFSTGNIVPSPTPKFNQSNERHQSIVPSMSPLFADTRNKLNANSPMGNTSSISESSISNENIARNMVERIDFGSMEDFLTNNDNLFANFWQGFNMD